MSTVGVSNISKGTVIARKQSKPCKQWGFNSFSLIFVCVLVNELSFVETRSVSRKARSLSSPYIIDARVDSRSFNVYWNSPTVQCHQYGINFDELTHTFGLKQNRGDTFRGDSISILYDPGKFPALLENGTQTELYRRNGGVPQEGSLKEHLDAFSKHIEELIPDGAFSGLGVIDFESWRPVFRQNFGKLTPYKETSYQIEKERHSLWPRKWIEREAARRFEESGRPYVEQTLALAREARPLARWGYYAYPYCFNMNNGKNQPNCPDEVVQENNDIQWLWDESDILLPSVYMGRKKMDAQGRLQLVRGRVTEAIRLAKKSKMSPTIYPYVWYKYNDDPDVFLTKEDLFNALNHMNKRGLAGAIIWGSSNDVSSKKRCLLLKEYVKNVLGPVVSQFVPMGSHKSMPLVEADVKMVTSLPSNDDLKELTFSTTNFDKTKSEPFITTLPDVGYVNNDQKRSTEPETMATSIDNIVTRTSYPITSPKGTVLYSEEESTEIQNIPRLSLPDTTSTTADNFQQENAKTTSAVLTSTSGSNSVANDDVTTISDKRLTEEAITANNAIKTSRVHDLTSLSSDSTVLTSTVPTRQQSVMESNLLLATLNESPSTFKIISNIPDSTSNELKTDSATPTSSIVSMTTSYILEDTTDLKTESDTTDSTVTDSNRITTVYLETMTIEPSSENSENSEEIVINDDHLASVEEVNGSLIESDDMEDDSDELPTVVNSSSVWDKIRKFFNDAFK